MHPKPLRRGAIVLVTAVGLTVLFSCGTAREARFTTPVSQPVTPSEPPQHADTLPSVDDVALKVGVRRSSFTEEGLRRDGSAYDTELRAQRVTKAGTFATFSPALDGDNDSFTDMALCFYVFDLSAYDRDPTLRLQWDTAPAAGSLWIALADVDENSWQFFQADEPVLNVGDLLPYTQLEGRLIVALIVMGNQPAVLGEIRVGSLSPTAAITADTLLGQPPLTVNLDASASADPDGALVSYDWDFDGDGAFDFNSGSDPTAMHVYDVPGDYTAAVKVTDDAGVTASAALAAPVHVIAPPVAALSADPVVGINPQEVDFDASASTDPEGTIAKYEWDYEGDGTYDADTGTTPTVTYEYTVFGGYSATVRVTSSTGAVDTQAIPISINESWMLPPDAQLQADVTEGNDPLTVNFDASASTDPDGVIEKYEWDYDGDGVFDADTGETAVASHTYDEPGDYSATVRVTDNIDATDLATVPIHVNIPPVADLTAPAVFGNAPFTVNFDASGTSDEDGTIVSYEWDWNNDGTYDDNSGNDPTESHIYSTPGIYTCQVRVTDDAGLTGTDTLLVDSNAQPTAAISQTANGTDAPRTVSFSTSGGGEPGGTIVKYEWDWTNDGTWDSESTYGSRSHTYGTGGTYTARVRITDDDGEMATATTSFTLIRVIVWSTQANVIPRDYASYGNHLAIAGLNGMPAVVYHPGFSSSSWAFGLVTGSNPLSSGSWTKHNVDGKIQAYGLTMDVERMHYSLTEERPAVAWVAPSPDGIDSGEDGLYFSRATTPTPTQAAHWVTYRIENGYNDTGYNPSLAVLGIFGNSRPMVSFYDEGAHELRFTRANSSTPGGSGDWNRSTVDSSGDVGQQSSLAIVAGVPAISFYDTTNDDLKYAFANDATPSNSDDWTEYKVSSSGGHSDLVQINGLPVIAWHDNTSSDLEYARGLVAEPDQISEWKFISVDTAGDTGHYASLGEYEGRPLIVYYDKTNGQRKYAWAKTNAPNSPSDWIIRAIPGTTTNRPCPITVIGSEIYSAMYYLLQSGEYGSAHIRLQRGNAP